MRRILRPARFRVALRTTLGFAALGVGSSVIGSAVVFLLLVLQGIPGEIGDRGLTLAVSAAVYVGLALVVGTAWTAFLQRRTAVWFALGRAPSHDEARNALRLPAHMSIVSGTLWTAGAVTLAALTWTLSSARDALGVFLVIFEGGLTTVGLMYLIAEWVGRPVMTQALAVTPPHDRLSTTVLTRLLLTWVLASGVPLLGVLLILLPPNIGTRDPRLSLVTLAVAGLVVGAVATALLARAVASPLRRLRRVLADVARGRTDASVPVDDPSEIGMLQASVNDLVSGLREQERMRDLFGRHVGADVARHALEYGASLSGDVRHVTALFVDVVDSTVLAYRLEPEELVTMLNRLFESVVSAVGTHGGLVNKFQGDAALCVFGAPTPLADPATAALQAARSIRDAVTGQGELDLGIGVSSGSVFAGQLGTSSRFEYTVIGDAVNEAARLTESAKQVPGRILVSSAVIDECAGHERKRWSPHEPISLRGRSKPTSTWQNLI